MKPSLPPAVARGRGTSWAARWLSAGLSAGLALIGGCTLAPAAPTVSGVSPEWGYNGEPTEIEIEGAHFFPSVVVTGEAGEGGRIEGTFQAWLLVDGEEVALEGVRHLSYDRLGADVPEGLPIGTYDLKVEVPSGLVATAEAAFTVTDTRADHLELSSDVAYEVGEVAGIVVRLKDPEDNAVAQAMDVVIRASSEALDAAGVTFHASGLVGQQPLEEGVGVRGSLAEDGTAMVWVTSYQADLVEFEALPADEPSPVRGDELKVKWDPGPVHRVELTLPREDFRTRAGDTFTLTIELKDAFDNVLTDQNANFFLQDHCAEGEGSASDLFTPVSVVGGRGEVEVELTGACKVASLSANDFATSWYSPEFEVAPGAHARYEVQAVPDPVTAGEPVYVIVSAVDEHGNLVPDHDADVRLFDNLGGLDPTRNLGEQTCPGFVNTDCETRICGKQTCDAKVWTSGPEVIIRAEDAQLRHGEAAPIEVLPNDPWRLLLVVGPSSVEAGEPFDVSVRVLDEYDNSIPFEPAGRHPVLFVDDSGTVACDWRGALDGAQTFECTIEGAVADAHLRATVLGVTEYAADPLLVTNADLEVVEVDPQGSSFVAGSAFTLELRGYDEFGNPYVVQTDADVDLSDTAGSMTPEIATLGPDGTTQVSAVLRGAGNAVRIYASQGGKRMGASRQLLVYPDVQRALTVEAPAWIDVDAPGEVTVVAVDEFDNAITTYAGTVTLLSAGDSCDPVTVDTFTNGSATVELTCTVPALGEVLLALDDGGYEGESGVLDVVDLACADGPTASLLLDGNAETVRCLAKGDTVEVDLDTSGSVAARGSVSVRHYTDGEEIAERTPYETGTLTYDSTGARYVEALVADSRGCADLAGAYVYVGSDDGEPTGPVTVSTSGSSPATGDTVTVNLAATDCTNDLAAGQTLYVRADLGTPGGTATGEGLAVTLDGSGAASLTWTFDTGYAGTATLYAGSAGGGAVGSKTVTVSGDTVRPTVLEVTPSGAELGRIPAIEIVFSEPMSSTYITSWYISLTGPLGSLAGAYTLSSDQTTVTIVPTVQLEGAAGAYTLSLSENLRDAAAGNRLDGGWSGTLGPATFTFGDVAEALPEISSCSASGSRFTPDGDDGIGAEADDVTVTPTATGSPDWWWLQVYGPDGERVRSIREPGTDASVSWDGRGNDGIVQETGGYRLSLSPIDAYGNVGGQCDVSVDLEQHVDLP